MGTNNVVPLSAHPGLYRAITPRLLAWSDLTVRAGRLSIGIIAKSAVPARWFQGAMLEVLGPGPKLAARVAQAEVTSGVETTLITEPLERFSTPERVLPNDTRIMVLGRSLAALEHMDFADLPRTPKPGALIMLPRGSR